MRTLVVAAVAAGVLFSCQSPANAKNDAEAKMHFEEGTSAFNLGEFDRAAAEYKLAYKASPDPSFLYNIAQSFRLANNLQEALFFYRSYLRNSPRAPNRDEVTERIAKLETQLRQQQAVATQPPNTPVQPNPTISSAPTTPPEPPPAHVQSAEGSAAATAHPALTSTADATIVGSAPPPRHVPAYKKWWLWTAVGVVAVGVGLGVGLGLGLGHSSPPASQLGNTGVF